MPYPSHASRGGAVCQERVPNYWVGEKYTRVGHICSLVPLKRKQTEKQVVQLIEVLNLFKQGFDQILLRCRCGCGKNKKHAPWRPGAGIILHGNLCPAVILWVLAFKFIAAGSGLARICPVSHNHNPAFKSSTQNRVKEKRRKKSVAPISGWDLP